MKTEKGKFFLSRYLIFLRAKYKNIYLKFNDKINLLASVWSTASSFTTRTAYSCKKEKNIINFLYNRKKHI